MSTKQKVYASVYRRQQVEMPSQVRQMVHAGQVVLEERPRQTIQFQDGRYATADAAEQERIESSASFRRGLIKDVTLPEGVGAEPASAPAAPASASASADAGAATVRDENPVTRPVPRFTAPGPGGASETSDSDADLESAELEAVVREDVADATAAAEVLVGEFGVDADELKTAKGNLSVVQIRAAGEALSPPVIFPNL